MPSTPTKTRQIADRMGGSDRLEKKPQSGRSISKQLFDDVMHNIPWDNDLENVPTGLSREDESIAREMKSDIIEMA